MPTDPEFWRQVATESFTLFVIIIGLFGLIVPIFPGLVVIWLATLFYGIASGFGTLGWILFAILTVLMIGGSLVDNLLMASKAREKGAAWSSILLGILAGVIFSFALPPIGGVIAAPLTLFLSEYFRRGRNAPEAWDAVKALLVGWGWAFLARFLIGLLMTGLWMIWAWA